MVWRENELAVDTLVRDAFTNRNLRGIFDSTKTCTEKLKACVHPGLKL